MSDLVKTPILLKLLTQCTLDQQSRVREIRNQSLVRASMYTDHMIALEEHMSWIERLRKDTKQVVFAVLRNNEYPIGLISVNAIDSLHKKADWAYYLDTHERGGLGSALEYRIIEFVFNELQIEKLNCEVIETNSIVLELHKKFKFVEEGFRRSNIIKNDKRIGVFFLGLTKDDWRRFKREVYNDRAAAISRFDIKILFN